MRPGARHPPRPPSTRPDCPRSKRDSLSGGAAKSALWSGSMPVTDRVWERPDWSGGAEAGRDEATAGAWPCTIGKRSGQTGIVGDRERRFHGPDLRPGVRGRDHGPHVRCVPAVSRRSDRTSAQAFCSNRRFGTSPVTANADAPCPVTPGRSSFSKGCVQAREGDDALPLVALHRSFRRLQSSAEGSHHAQPQPGSRSRSA
jgi:hypothetical protein